jgi:hypothetical protein
MNFMFRFTALGIIVCTLFFQTNGMAVLKKLFFVPSESLEEKFKRIQELNKPQEIVIDLTKSNWAKISRHLINKKDPSHWDLQIINATEGCLELEKTSAGLRATQDNGAISYSWGFIGHKPGTAFLRLAHVYKNDVIEKQIVNIIVR